MKKHVFCIVSTLVLVGGLSFNACKKESMENKNMATQRPILREKLYHYEADSLIGAFSCDYVQTNLYSVITQYQIDNWGGYLYFIHDEDSIKYGHFIGYENMYDDIVNEETYEEIWNEFNNLDEAIVWLDFRFIYNSQEAVVYQKTDGKWIVIVEDRTYY